MAKSAKKTTNDAVTSTAHRAVTLRRPANGAADDIASRAYALYLARGEAHGHDLDDWLQAEREWRHES